MTLGEIMLAFWSRLLARLMRPWRVPDGSREKSVVAPASTRAACESRHPSAPIAAVAPAVAGFVHRVDGPRFLLPARLASVARLNVRHDHKPTRHRGHDPQIKPIPVAKRTAKKAPRPAPAPVLLRARPAARQPAPVVRLPARSRNARSAGMLAHAA